MLIRGSTAGAPCRHYAEGRKPDTKDPTYIRNGQQRQIRSHREESGGCQRLGEGGMGVAGHKVSLWGDGKVLELDFGDGRTAS